jgi:hypothetical protein
MPICGRSMSGKSWMGKSWSAKRPNKTVTATPTATAAGLFKLAAVNARNAEPSSLAAALADLRGEALLLEVTTA